MRLILAALILLALSIPVEAQDSECLPADLFIAIVQARAANVTVERIEGDRAQALLAAMNALGGPHTLEADELVVLSRPDAETVLVNAFSDGCRTWAATMPPATYQALPRAALGNPI